MKFNKALLLLISLLLISASDTFAQDSPSAAQTAEHLRAQLRDVQAEEADLKAHQQQLEWELKPENIERYFAGTGSTRPEELREQRRRQLQTEKESVRARLARLSESRSRLESAISTADAEAYMQSAEGTSPAGGLNQMSWSERHTNTLLIAGVLTLIAIVGALALVTGIRRRRLNRIRY